MELENTSTEPTTTESVDTGNSAPDTPAPQPETGLDALKSIPKAKDQTAQPVDKAPAYQPNYKFKANSKEHEIDEWIRPVIKNQDIEKKVKELYEKAYGLDEIKPKHQSMLDDLEKSKAKIMETDKALDILGKYVAENDFDSFFEGLNIPKNKILEYALELVKREQMTPEQKTQWEAGRQAREAARFYELKNAELLESQQQFAVQQRTFELDNAMQQPEARAVADAYNAGMGTPQAFKDYCIQIGQAYAARGQDISAQQAVSEAVRHLRAVNPGLVQAQAPSAAPVVQASQKPVIPNIQGRGTSAVKSTVKSLDDLKKRARDLADNY